MEPEDPAFSPPNLKPPGRNPSGVSLMPPGRNPSGVYAEHVRNWGDADNTRRPEESAAQSLAPPRRNVSNAGAFSSRIQSTLIVAPIPEAPPEAEGDAPSRGRAPPPPTKIGKNASVAGGRRSIIKGPPPTGRNKKASGSTITGGSFRSTSGNRASTIQGRTTVRFSVLPVGNNRAVANSLRESAQIGGLLPKTTLQNHVSFAPKRLLDIENGTSILVTNQKFLDHHRFQELGSDGALVVVTARATAPIAKEDYLFFQERGQSLQDKIQTGDIRDFETNEESGILGGAWRGALRRLMVWALDDINGLRLGRQLQLFLPFLTGYESYIVGQIIESLDSPIRKSDVSYVLKVAFKNRNVSRIIVQNVGPRWDFLWHWHHQVSWNRMYDGWGQLPIVGFTSFPASENFPSTRDHVVASSLRVLFGEGRWLTRVLTQNRQGLNTDNPDKNISQNLSAESNGFELANRNQYGTYVGRLKTNHFRLDHRLPTDESIVRTFVAQPMPTLVNNGVVHTLRQLAKHWHNMIFQFSGNFAHQRMEQLDPFETMRFHMPVVCVALSSLRGRNRWDGKVLGPFIRKCQELKPSITADGCRYLVREMQEHVVVNLCGGVASVIDPLRSWLDAIMQACDMIEVEAKEMYQEITSVEIGLRLGHDLITQVSWKIPSDKELKKAILAHIHGKNPGPLVGERRIRSAMLLTTPRDKRTLIELVKNNHSNSKPAQLLLGRVKTLLQRDLRREALNEAIRELSMGDPVTEVVHDEWYWLEEKEKRAVYIYDAKVTGKDLHRFVHVDSGFEKFVTLSDEDVKFRGYVPVAEAISRAQRCYMNVELDYGKKFKFNAFMEFSFLRIALRRLAVISQVYCEELDNARLNVLREVQRSNQTQVGIHEMEPGKTYYTYDGQNKTYEAFVCEKEYTPADPEWQTLARTLIVKVPPQSIIVVGGGPTGLMTVIHCTENVLISGGVMKLYEARDAFSTGGSTFERAQIVRLDGRWIAMLRYHLGTGFEDVYIPASGETDAQLGNTLPSQGFVEITIKDLENMLHVEVSRMWSKGVIQCYTNSKSQYDLASNALTKMGDALKVEDRILRRVDPNGKPVKGYYSWKIANLVYIQALGLDDLRVGEEYAVYIRLKNAVLPFKLTGVDLQSRTYTFKSLKNDAEDLKATAHNLPSVYPKGTARHGDVEKIVVECVQKGSSGGYNCDELPMKLARKEKFTLDIGHTHVVECTGKPLHSKVHFACTTYEPYGVCCIQGLKISMGMHNFGETRWGSGLLDDFRSKNDQNTRIIGDFTKMVRQPPIAEHMLVLIKTENWKEHFNRLVKESKFPELNELDPIFPKLEEAVSWHAKNAKSFNRQTLQTRFFETGDNYYLGMEFTREYDKWKNKTADELLMPLTLMKMDDEKKKEIGRLKGTFTHHIDRLWYDACLEIIRRGDVYNPGARKLVPRLYLINSYSDENLGGLPVGESFRLSERPEERYEVVVKQRKQIVVRNIEGYISKMPRNTQVRLEGNLTRAPDGNRESRVSLATFPVGHYVNFRTVRLNNESRGYVFTFVGDEQATPHFMRYSGLTGACINSMLFNNFVKSAVRGETFQHRFKTYANETDWCNTEVVTRGTGSNYGRDGFLRPGFKYAHGLEYLHSKVIECMETKKDLDDILSRDWKEKFASAMVPRGMELNEEFIRTLYDKCQEAIFNKFVQEVKADKEIASDPLVNALMSRKDSMANRREDLDHQSYWTEFLVGMEGLADETRTRLQDFHCEIAKRVEQTVTRIVEYATKAYLHDERIIAELFNQPKAVDSIVDDFAVEAQNFANGLVMSAAFSAGALAFALVDISQGDEDRSVGTVFSAILAAFNILISFGTMTNVSRYKIRNEEARILFFNDKFLGVKKAVFSVMDKKTQDSVPEKFHPFLVDLDKRVDRFLYNAEYYDMDDPTEFKDAYSTLKANINDHDAILDFQKKLSTVFIADVYHVNSYLQESLVDIYKICEDMKYLLSQELDKTTGGETSKHLFNRLTHFSQTLDASLQRGHIFWGFLKHRKFVHWDISVVIRYFWSLFCCARAGGRNPLAPIQTETLGILKEARVLSALHSHTVIRREVRDIEYLYWATRESDIASLIFVSSFLVNIVSWIFTISRIVETAQGGEELVTDFAFYATLASATGAILAAFHFQRKIFILIGLWFTLGKKKREAGTSDDREAISKVRGITSTQILLTLTRLLTAYAAGVALPWSVAQNTGKISTPDSIPFWIALGAICGAIGSTIFFFIVEYVVRYNLSPKLGEYVCEAFREEIETMFKVLSVPINSIDTKQVQERETWEYVAREFLHKYRFDTVFAADRFGSILQYIQSGMDPRQ